MEKLWGDNFFDPATKKWTNKPTGSATCKRGFCQFIYEPIKVGGGGAGLAAGAGVGGGRWALMLTARVPAAPFQPASPLRAGCARRLRRASPSIPPRLASPRPRCLPPVQTVIEAAMNDNKDKLFGLLEKLEVMKKLKPEDKELMGKPLMKRVMQAGAGRCRVLAGCWRVLACRVPAGAAGGCCRLGPTRAALCAARWQAGLRGPAGLRLCQLARSRATLLHPPPPHPRSPGCPPPRRCWR